MLNLMRQLGGSFGIASLSTFITNQTQVHRADLVSNVYQGNPAFDTMYNGLTANFQSRGFDLPAAQSAALSAIDRTVQTQAQVLSFANSFLLIGVAMVLVAPCVFLLRSNSSADAAAAAAESH